MIVCVIAVWIIGGIYKLVGYTTCKQEWPNRFKSACIYASVFIGALTWPLELLVLLVQIITIWAMNPDHIRPLHVQTDVRYIYSMHWFFKFRGYFRYYVRKRCPKCNEILSLNNCTMCDSPPKEVIGRYLIWISSRYELISQISMLEEQLECQRERIVELKSNN